MRIPQFVIGVEFSGYRSANPRFAPAIYRSASPSDPPATRAACQSPALPSNSTSRLSSAARFSSWLSGQSPACAFNPPCRSTFWPILRLASPYPPSASPFGPDLRLAPPAVPPAHRSFDLEARALWPFVRLRLPSGFQLAPSADPPALPSNLTSDSHRLLHPLASPSSQPSACASSQPSGCAFQPASGSRLPPTFQLCLRTCLQLAPLACSGLRLCADFQLAPSIDLPAHRSRLSPACAFDPALRLRLSACLQLAPPANLPALPSDPTSDSHRMSYSLVGSGSSPACAFNQPCSTFWPILRLASPYPALRLRLSINLRLAPPANLWPAFRLPSSLRLRSVFRLRFPADVPACAFRSTLQPWPSNFNFRLTARHQLRRTLGACHLCTQVQIGEYLWISSFLASLAVQCCSTVNPQASTHATASSSQSTLASR